MFNVAYQITVGSTTLQSGQAGYLLSLDTRASLSIPVNACQLVLKGQSDISTTPGDVVTVDLGYDHTLSRVFTGAVVEFEQGIHQSCIEALGAFNLLTTARLNLLYEKQSAGDIVGDTLSQLKLTAGNVEAGEKFSAYTISDRQSVWAALQNLAQRCGFDFYADAEDKAVFQKCTSSMTHSFDYAVHILAHTQANVIVGVDGVEVYGESPVGQGQGEDTSSWLTKKEVKGTAGKSAGNVRRIAEPAARAPDLARSVAANLLPTYQVKTHGRLRVLGAPAIHLSDAVQVSQMPNADQNGTFKVTGVRHRLSSASGFITEIDWEQV